MELLFACCAGGILEAGDVGTLLDYVGGVHVFILIFIFLFGPRKFPSGFFASSVWDGFGCLGKLLVNSRLCAVSGAWVCRDWIDLMIDGGLLLVVGVGGAMTYCWNSVMVSLLSTCCCYLKGIIIPY